MTAYCGRLRALGYSTQAKTPLPRGERCYGCYRVQCVNSPISRNEQ